MKRGPVLRRQLVAAGGSAGAVQGSLTYPLDLVTPPTPPSFPSLFPSPLLAAFPSPFPPLRMSSQKNQRG